MLLAKFRTLLNPAAYSLEALRAVPGQWNPADLFVMACLLLLAAVTLVLESLSVSRKSEAFYFLRRPLVLAVLVILTVLLAPGRNNRFIYFAF